MHKLTLTTKIFFAIATILFILASGFLIAKYGSLGAIVVFVFLVAIPIVYKIFKDPLWGFSAIVFFLPFERFPTYEIAGINLKINTILGFIVLLAWIFAIMFNAKKWKLQPNILAIPIALFILAVLLSITQAINLERAYIVTTFVIFTILLSILAINLIANKDDLIKIIRVLLISSLVVGGFGLFQFAGDVVGLPNSITLLKQGYDSRVFGFPRIQAFSMEPLYYADYLFIPICLGLAYFFGQVKNFFWNRWVIIVLVIMLLLNFILTVSRGAYLGFIASFLILAVLLFKKIFTWKHILIGLIAIAIVGYGVAFALSKGDTRATNEFMKHVFLRDYTVGESVQGRLSAFEQALQAYNDNPVLGIGIGNYGPYTRGYPGFTPFDGWAIVNNEYLEILAETGLVGMVTFGLILVILIWRSLLAIIKSKDDFLKLTMIGLLAAFGGILAQYASFSTLYIMHIWVLIGLMVVTQNLIFKKEVA